MGGLSCRASARPFALLSSTMLTGLTSLFDGFTLMPVAIQYAFVIAFGLVIGSFVTVVVHRVPRVLERNWDTSVAEYLEERTNAAMASAEADETTVTQDRAVPGRRSRGSEFAPTEAAARADTPAGKAKGAETYNLMHPGSHCDACGHRLRVWENIPVLSYLLLRGRCGSCHTRISIRYPLLELASGLLAALAWWRFGPGFAAIAAFGFAAVALTLSCIDWETGLLPDAITLPFLWAGLLINLDPSFATLGDAVIGAAAGYVFLWCVYWGFWWWRGVEGIGHGDLKLFAALGAWLGWTGLVQVLVLASAAGALVGLAMLATRRMKRDEPLPFGPFLAVAGCITLFAGTPFWPSLPLYGSAGLGG
ncbi:prepilin peptidase [Pararobbsia alpina]|uniref:Prepilin leader peptidase/N-methyltransferase n=1 Tax=Pararobbsia alpina TaxID=621374 RepID=A0A6S7ATP7_9BURK|nr:A24 family peptidase [Pararobbsia alpina]CAB3777572.1 Type 4 prepilin-like proteins leader peptide-processing enzyme [Pararobbsia alpina]